MPQIGYSDGEDVAVAPAVALYFSIIGGIHA
jgi:hypothetical protein